MQENNSEAGSKAEMPLRRFFNKHVSDSDDFKNELLEAFNRLEEERRHSNVVLAAVAHDMKAPVAIFTGYLKLLETEKLGPLNQRQREILEDMNVSCVRMKHLISEFLTYGATGAENHTNNFESGDLRKSLEEVCRDWAPLCRVQSVTLNFEPCQELSPFPFDHQKIKQAVACLIDNALKFTPAGGSVRLAVEPHFWERRLRLGVPVVERRSVSSFEPNSVLISVTDTGPGIAPEYQQEVFEEFYTRRCGEVQSSTGLGLAISRRVAQAHGGKIWVESTVGVGSKFCIVLPLRPPTVKSSGLPRNARVAHG